jgi:transcriptional regulator with XRE-family HTH domain
MPSTKKWSEIRMKQPLDPAAQEARLEALRAEEARYQHTLAQVRKARQKTQVAVAAEMGIAQGEISRLEKRADAYLSTLEQYVQALGGELRLVAVFEGEEFELQLGDLVGVSEPATELAESTAA